MKETEIGEIPEDWKLDYLENITKQISDIDHFMPPSVRVGIPYLMTSDLQPKISQVNFDECKQVDGIFYDRFARKIKAELDDIVFARYATIGTVSYVDINKKFLVSYSCVVIKPHLAKVYGKYLYHYFKSDVFFKSVELLLNSNIQSNIGIDGLNRTKILLPSKQEQEQIIEVLSDTDNLIQATEQLINKKQLIKTATMQNLLTGKIRLAEFDTKQTKLSELGEIPSDWDVVNLGNYVEIRKGETITLANIKYGDIPVIAGGKKPAYFHNQANRFGKTITISASGASAGFVSFHENNIFASDCSTISESKKYSIEYLFYNLLLRQSDIYKMQAGGAQPHVQPKDLKPMLLVLSNNYEEQNMIAQIFLDMDKELTALNERLTKLNDIKQGLMQDLLTGKIRLTE
ncbi:restriction endonuclease subunit S [Moraxella osloensis]|nr:restriction endonuclease subunit S [Moraxella osloensis]